MSDSRPRSRMPEVANDSSKPPAAELGWAKIQLPSRGVLYDGKMPDGLVMQRKMRSVEQARLQSQGGNALERIEAIVNSCTRLPEGFSPKDLLLTDSFFLLLALRTMSFGAEYTFRWKCRYCSNVSKQRVDIVQDLEEKPAPPSLHEPIDIQLVDAGCKVSCRFLRVSDQTLITRHSERVKLSSNDADDPAYLYRLALQLVARDDVPFQDILRKQDFITSLTSADALRIEQGVDAVEPGVDVRVTPTCSGCGALNEVALPFDAEFFRPSRL